MKRIFSSFRSVAGVAGILTAGVILLSACSKFHDDNNNENPVAGLMSFNLAPDQPGIDIELSGNLLTNQSLGYGSYSGNYQLIYPGNREVKTTQAGSDSSVATQAYTFMPQQYYSLFVTGANGNYQNVVTNDNLDSLTATTGKAFVRYINAIPDSTKPAVTIASGSNNVFNDNASFNHVSDFKAIDAGNVSITINNGSTINNVNRSITLEQGKVYTVLLGGLPAATDSTKAVQIKYITNGSVDSSK
jgi:hypothetical protein